MDQTSSQTSAMGVAFRNLNVFGYGSRIDYQKSFFNYPLIFLRRLCQFMSRAKPIRIDILRSVEGLVQSGEVLVVLGKPGSGCSTFLKVLAGQTYGLHVDKTSQLNYSGLSAEELKHVFRGRAVYQAEIDVHFPHLTVKQTLGIAAAFRPASDGESDWENHVPANVAASMGLMDVLDTKVGNDYVRGVSGGERKRTSIAEILASNTWVQCWDNSTRGLDSATALNFISTVKSTALQRQCVALVSLYQASQDAFDLCDTVLLLYEGHQIFFGSTQTAKAYFVDLGFECPERSNVPDFLTSVTNPRKRKARDGYELRVPRTPQQFAQEWLGSPQRTKLLEDIRSYESAHALGQDDMTRLRAIHHAQQAKNTSLHSVYIIPVTRQVLLCLRRCFLRVRQDAGALAAQILGNMAISVILGSMFYNMQQDTASFQGRSVLIFFGIVLNSNVGAFEGTLLWEQRPIVEKHSHYAFYQPVAEALASMLSDVPNKIVLTVAINTPYYFLANLRRSLGAYLIYLVFGFASILTGSMLWRADGAASRTLEGSIPLGSAFGALTVIYTGFIIPVSYMHPWLKWFAYINPGFYAFESLMANEFSGRQFQCSAYVPQGPSYEGTTSRVCNIVGGSSGSTVVDGDAYLANSYEFDVLHLWRNLAIMLSLAALLCTVYLSATALVTLQPSRGEILIFRKRSTSRPVHRLHDEEEQEETTKTEGAEPLSDKSLSMCFSSAESVGATFAWENLSYSVPIHGKPATILDNVEGWIKPGTLNALVGQTGAGKTSLLNVLAGRAGVGIVDGYIGVNSRYENRDFASKIGYAQQQDLHISSATVRETLVFSGLLRQPETYTTAEKLMYVDTVISLLDMEQFADAVVGIPGEGLNIEQRKRLTIGVELAARPELLIFLDEPTSGMDSDTAWSICQLLRRLANSGQAILCTLHQPSSLIFELFDRLIVLSKGHQVYFGQIGERSQILTDYFEALGVPKCARDENPAEWLLHLLDSRSTDMVAAWRASAERSRVLEHIAEIKSNLSALSSDGPGTRGLGALRTFSRQLRIVLGRTLRHDWRTPSYLWSMTLCTLFYALLNGFSFWQAPNTIQGLQNQFFSLFIFLGVFSSHLQIIVVRFVEMRTIYEAREQPSRFFPWPIFILSQVLAALLFQTVMAVITFVAWYYPLGWFHNAMELGSLNERAGLIFLFVWTFMVWTQTYTQLVGTFSPDSATGVAVGSVLYIIAVLFSGLFLRPDALPRFWVFLYRASPISYYVSGMIATALAGVEVTCAESEVSVFDPPPSTTCGQYLADYLDASGARLFNPDAATACHLCSLSDSTALLANFGIYDDDRWRDLGIAVGYVAINVILAMLLYWIARVPKGAKTRERNG